jgi:uncharacterized protein (TIGR03032 family)
MALAVEVLNAVKPMDTLPDVPARSDKGDEPSVQFRYVHSTNFPELLESLNATLLVTTYQAGKLVAFRACEGRLSMLLRTFDRVMGLALGNDVLALGTRSMVWLLRNSSELAAKSPDGHDAFFLPRLAYVTGDLDFHEMAWGDRDLWAANTLFSCLCTLHPDYSFVPRWRPPFVTQLARQDRCHLNGLAMDGGRPCYVTAFGESDTPNGWRPTKAEGGILLEVPGGDVVARGLSMPHSPRLVERRLWVLDSGRGGLALVDRNRGTVDTVAKLPGYTRGLAIQGRYAFVGHSKIRETAIFGGVPIAEDRSTRKCGVTVVDLQTGSLCGFIDFEGIVEEIFDVQLLPGIRFPQIVGLQKDTIQRACLIGPEIDFDGRAKN